MSDESHQQQEGGQGGPSKILKRFEKNVERLEQILQGDTTAYSTKVPAAGLPALMAELVKERREAAEKHFKTEMAALLDKKVAFDKEVKNMRRETEKAIEKKMEEFNKDMERVFNIIERVDQTATDYADALKNTGGSSEGDKGSEGGHHDEDEDLGTTGV